MRKKEKKVTYRQSVNFKLLSERQLENIFPGWNDLLDRIDSYRKWLGKKQIKREECINKQYNLMYENVYTILGGRGSGKTSAIFTLREYLEEDSVNNIVLPIVMPEVIPEHGETLGWILASLEELVKKLSDALEVQEKNRDNFFHECKRQKVSLADLYDEVKELCYSRQTKDGGTSFSEEIKINERRNQSGYELSKKMAEFWMQLVEAVKIVKHRKEKDDQKEPLIYLIFDDGKRISFECKYTETEFGGISSDKRDPNKYNKKYNRKWDHIHKNLVADSIFLFTDKKEFYRHYQINRNIVYADSGDYVLFLTPRANDAKGICDGRTYIDNMENQHIRNIYWEDMIQITLLTVAECEPLKDYYFKFKSKYLDSWNEEH